VSPTTADIDAGVAAIAAAWKGDRPARQARRHLEQADFDALRDAGILQLAVPEAMGGTWRSVPESTRGVAEVLRKLAGADPSVALVSSMHPAVLGFWLAPPDPGRQPWTTQRDAVFETARDGLQWGTITSEPGSGGDIARTKSVAAREGEATGVVPGGHYLVTGDKHFGSGSGVTSFMITTAVPDDDDKPAIFAIDVRDRPWDGSAGLQLIAEWDGAGMAATQSHAMRLEGCPAVRMAWDGPVEDVTLAAAPITTNLFTAVVLGILDEAVATAKAQLAPKAAGMRAYEQVEWSRAELDHWMAVQVFEGSLRAVESGNAMRGLYAGIRAKQGVAELAESCLSRITRVIGGGSFARRSPFASWYEDVRALGFLRPPWGLAYDNLFASSFL
jgi:alkylation response protein AidB-like acyl-CoA dehydrogenase